MGKRLTAGDWFGCIVLLLLSLAAFMLLNCPYLPPYEPL